MSQKGEWRQDKEKKRGKEKRNKARGLNGENGGGEEEKRSKKREIEEARIFAMDRCLRTMSRQTGRA